MDINHILKHHAYQNIPLSYDEAYQLGEYVIRGCEGDQLAQIQSTAVLTALHNRATYSWTWSKSQQSMHSHELPQNAASQIAGICAAVFEQDIAKSKFGFITPALDFVMDNCGMGGDLVVTSNVSTIAAFIAATAGIPMCKHGSPANADEGRQGSSDFISSLGIRTLSPKEGLIRCLEKEKFGYTEALDLNYKRIHIQTHSFARLPHMNDIIGVITNPVNPQILRRRIVGVNHLVDPLIVAQAYKIMNEASVTQMDDVIVVRGYIDGISQLGIDEASICAGGTSVARLSGGYLSHYNLPARNFGLVPVSGDSISPPKGMSKGKFSEQIMSGKISGSPLQLVLANAALLFHLANGMNLRQCYEIASDVFHSGKVVEKVEAVREMLS